MSQGAVQVQVEFQLREGSSSWEFMGLASLAVCLDQEQDLVELVPDGIQGSTSAKQSLLKKLIQMNYQS
jgi:hypothetical protein